MTLEGKGIRVVFGTGSGQLTAVDGVDFKVPDGGTLGIVGESGCGKSTLARAIVGLTPLAGGQVLLDGKVVRWPRPKSFKRRVAIVFQDPYSSLNPRLNVGDTLRETMIAHYKLDRRSQDREIASLLELVGLPQASIGRFPHEFSGGQRQRVAIARALAVRSDVIIADEITSALDVSVQARILNLMKSLQRTLKLSMVFISHDMAAVRYVSDVVGVMYLGRFVEVAPASELFTQPRHPYTKVLMDSVPSFYTGTPAPLAVAEVPDPRHPPMACRFHPRCPVGILANPARTLCSTVEPDLVPAGADGLVACHYPLRAVEVRPSGSVAESC